MMLRNFILSVIGLALLSGMALTACTPEDVPVIERDGYFFVDTVGNQDINHGNVNNEVAPDTVFMGNDSVAHEKN